MRNVKMLKTKLKTAFTVVLFISQFVFAADETKGVVPSAGLFGAGPITGNDPWIGGTIKYWFSDKVAIDASVGALWGLHMMSNITYNHIFFPFPKGEMALTFGGGLFMKVFNGFDMGMQGETGVEWFMPWAPVGVFADYCPTFSFFDNDDDNIFFYPGNFIIGARYYF
jgi:hypothetical protein